MHAETLSQFGSWRVVRALPPRPSTGGRTRAIFLCECSCGVRAEVLVQNLRNGASTRCVSCYAASKKGVPARNKTHGESHRTTEHRIWRGMHERCAYPKHIGFKSYGGRGIKVCARWSGPVGYENFLADMGRRPSLEHSIDRIDNGGDYAPENCRWATRHAQARNRKTSLYITAFGETLTLAEWSRRTGVYAGTIRDRLVRQRLPAEIAVARS